MKKYDEKYFGIAAGTFAAIIFLPAVIKIIFSGALQVSYLKPFIPFFDSASILNILGEIVVSFLWGWVLGYFFMLIYHWLDKKLNGYHEG